jgi:RIO-like serine/threonine protein kinase
MQNACTFRYRSVEFGYNKLTARNCHLDRLILSQAMEDYLKATYKLMKLEGTVTTSALAEYMGVAPASVTNMCKKLAELKLLEYEPYQGVKFTPAGEKLALEIVRHHRLIELYLAEALGVPWDRVHEEAEKLEHLRVVVRCGNRKVVVWSICGPVIN